MSESRLTRIELDSDCDEHFVYIDKSEIIAIQVQLPISSSLALQGEGSLGAVRVFCKELPAPFQFTRETADEIEEVVKQLVE